MAHILITQASVGAPTCNGVAGSAVNILRHGLALKSWTETHGGGAGTDAVFRAASGIRDYIQARHTTAASGGAQRCVFRAAELATSTTALTDPYPKVADVADTSCNLITSSTADATARNYELYVDDTWFLFLTQFNGTAWDFVFFGEPPGIETGDSNGSVIIQRNSASATTSACLSMSTTPQPTGNLNIWWRRDRSGATKATRGTLFGSGTFGNVSGQPAARAGYANRIKREKVGINCSGSNTNTANSMAIDRRGWLPVIWNPLHLNIGTAVEGADATDTAYNPSAQFFVKTTTTTAWALTENSLTWQPPGG